MANKYETMTALYDETCQSVIGKPENWMDFLKCAGRNYRLRFDGQLMLYAQRPDATAVLTVEDWNQKFHRWIRKGSKGIAVFDDDVTYGQKLKYYFDVSDTHEGKDSKPVTYWKMNSTYEKDVMDAFDRVFGTVEDKSDFAQYLMKATEKIINEHSDTYINALLKSTRFSSLEGMRDDDISSGFRKLAVSSVQFMILHRLGYDTESYFDSSSFQGIADFNTKYTLNALGFAASDFGMMELNEIARTIVRVKKLEKMKKENEIEDRKGEIKDNENHVYNEEQLSDSGSDSTEPDRGSNGILRSGLQPVSETETESALLQSSDGLQTERSSAEDREESQTDGIGTDGTDDSGRQYEQDEFSGNEEPEDDDSADGLDEVDRELDYYDIVKGPRTSRKKYFFDIRAIRELLVTTRWLRADLDEIRKFYEAHLDSQERAEFIRSLFGAAFTEELIEEGQRRVGYKKYQNGVLFWDGSYLNREAECFLNWETVSSYFEVIRMLGGLSEDTKHLAYADEHESFDFSDEIISMALKKGSQISQGKMRIYHQFMKGASNKENADFLKNEYGMGGCTSVITGIHMSESHDSNGIELRCGWSENAPSVLIKWNDAAERIKLMIHSDIYLDEEEKEKYALWLSAREKNETNIQSIVMNEYGNESDVNENMEYVYEPGNMVYIENTRYEILSCDDRQVCLYDFEFPLFNREMSIEEFERLLVNNPQNEYLKQSVVEDRHSDLKSLISSAESRCEEVNRYKDMKTPVYLEK